MSTTIISKTTRPDYRRDTTTPKKARVVVIEIVVSTDQRIDLDKILDIARQGASAEVVDNFVADMSEAEAEMVLARRAI